MTARRTSVSIQDLAALTAAECRAISPEPNAMSAEDAELIETARVPAGLPAEVPVSVMLDNALKAGASVDALKGMYELFEKEQKRRAEADLNAALAEFKRTCPRVTRNREGFHKRKDGTPTMYADLSHTLDTVGPAMTECGLSASWNPTHGEGWVEQECIIRHAGGACVSARSVRFPLAKNADAGEVLKVDGYCRRNAFNNAAGLTSVDEEDESAAPDPITADQVTTLEGWLSETGDADGWRPRLLKWAGVDSVDKIPATKYAEAVARAKAKKGVRAS